MSQTNSKTPSPYEMDATDGGRLSFTFQEPPRNLVFYAGDKEVLKFEEGGKVFVRGELVDDNKKIYAAIKDFLGMGKT
jgi:hypothetical protein